METTDKGWIDLHIYIGLLILEGVYRSQGKPVYSLRDAESGRAIFHTTKTLKVFHTFSRMLQFDNRKSRPERHASDKLEAIRAVWEKWVKHLPYLYNPLPEITGDEHLVPFKGKFEIFSAM